MANTWSTRTTYQGHRVNYGTWFILVALNILLRLKTFGGETSNVTMLQGGYNAGGVAASAGTHDGGGAFDLTPFNWRWRVWLLRLLGCAAWYRPYNWDNRGGGAHIHVEVAGDGTASRGGKAQVVDYKNGLNGLANRAKDPNKRPHGLLLFFHFPTNTDLAVRYAICNTTMRDQPSGSGVNRGTLKKRSKFTPIALVKNSSGNLWAVNKNEDWAYLGDLTKKRPILSIPTKPVPLPEPVPAPVIPIDKPKTLTLHVGNINVIRWRLGKKNVRNYDGFKVGADYSTRVKGLAQMVHDLGVSVFGTEESGQYADADLLTKTLGNDKWTNVLHGDDAGDITEAVHTHEKRRVLATGKIVTGDAAQVAYHNTATYSLLQDSLGSDVLFLFVATHSEYRPAGVGRVSQYDKNREEDTKVLIQKAEKIAFDAAVKYKVDHIPVVFVGDWNQDKDDYYDGPGRAMKAASYVDCETIVAHKTGPETTYNGLDKTKTSGRALDRIFVKLGTPADDMVTIAGYPNTDHNGRSVKITLTNN